MQVKNLQAQKGFTLVEIAIVLVIIGLLLGGVLKGQELITNAKIKSVTSDFDSISAAYYAYQDRTGNIAGDTTEAGAKDGAIDTDDDFWFDLKTEGFIGGTLGTELGSDGPVHDLDGTWSATAGAASGALFTGNHICASGIADTYAQGMDTKLDDGDATTGSIRSGTDAAAATALAYTDTGVLRTVCKEL